MIVLAVILYFLFRISSRLSISDAAERSSGWKGSR